MNLKLFFLFRLYFLFFSQKPTVSDPLGYLKRAGVLWDRRVRKSLNAMCTELKVPLHGQPRISADREDFMAKWNELSNYNMGGLLRLCVI